jgi:hypothetical protein
MNKRELRELEFSRKKYDVLPTEEIRNKVMELEKSLDGKLSVWDDEQTYAKYQMINSLNLSDKRLLLVFSIFDGSVAKTASYFSVNRKTILTNIQRIKEILEIC